MAVNKDIRICKHCGKKYSVENQSDCFPGGKEREEIFCPNCGKIDGYMRTSGYPFTQKGEA